MTRCPACRAAAPEEARFCQACGAALAPPPQEPFWRREDWFDARLARRALAVALAMGALRLAAAPLLLHAAGGRSEASYAAFHLVQGLGLGLCLAWVRGEGRLAAWPLLGLAGGALGYALDYLYNYQGLVYRAVWWAVYWLWNPAPGSQFHAAYGVLQVLRLLPLAALLALASTPRRPALGLKRLLALSLSLALAYPLRGATLLGASAGEFLGNFALYYACIFTLFYGLGGPVPDRSGVDGISAK